MHHLRGTTTRRARLRRSTALVGVLAAAIVLAACSSNSSSSTTTTTPSGSTDPVELSGVTINFGDQFKEYQTAFNATGALNGVPYGLSWSEFVGGPPIVTAQTGGSVDLGNMAETPTIFAQAADDPVKVIAVTKGADPKASPFGVLVPKGSPIKTVAELRGKTIAVQEGTVEQYLLIQILKKAGIPYTAVHIDNLTVTDATTAVANGKVDAAVSSQPLIGLNLLQGKVTELVSGAGYTQNLGYIVASQSALGNPQKAAAISDFVNRFYKSLAILRKNPDLAANTYVKTYGVPVAVAKEAVNSVQAVGTPITPAIIQYQQNEANTFHQLGLIPNQIKVNSIFDLPYNKKLVAAAGLTS